MAITTVNSRATLIDYCLRKLGHPVIEINVDEDQLDDRIDEAFEVWREFHTDASTRFYITHIVTQDDIDNGYIDMDTAGVGTPSGGNGANILSVKRVMPMHEGSTGGMFGIEYQLRLNDILDFRTQGGGGLSNYYQLKQYLNLMDRVLDGEELFRYNRHTDKLYIDTNWDLQKPGNYIAIECVVWIPADFGDYEGSPYRDLWLKKFATALIKQQWGMNLIKFEGMVLPGGVTLNGRQLFDDASGDIEQLMEELRMTWEMPVDFITG